MMKKMSLLALATTLVLGLGSCSKNSNESPQQPDGTTRLKIQLAGVKAPNTRALESPADENDLTVVESRSLIFVADPTDQIVQVVNIVLDEATSNPGQVLDLPVPLGSSVYVVANIPTADYTTLHGKQTLTDLKAAVSQITTQQATEVAEYQSPVIANLDGTEALVPTTDTGGDGVETVSIEVEPLISRLEVVSLEADEDPQGYLITDFEVTGIFIDEYFPAFTYTGAASGSAISLIEALETAAGDASATAAVYTGWEMKDDADGPWSADGSPALVQPGGGDVWAYNLVAGGLPRIVIRLDNIEYTNPAGQTGLELTGARYITVEGYTGSKGSISSFDRGEVYRVGTIDTDTGESNFKFNFSHLGLTPDEQSVSLTVSVEVLPWNVEDYVPILKP
uniref:Major fimbrial subunit protein N-terminal domain-containing protein n=1 Tax=uncultured bacterium contig00003(2014) TaxID=1465624 RepID=A0A060CWG6_9BACT|nr:hypothetical protein [uncultured bacterium contig00003(2014)]